MSTIAEYLPVIESGIQQLGIDPTACRGPQTGQWHFNRGSAKIVVGITQSERYPHGYFYVSSILIQMNEIAPSRKEEFYRTLLETNASLCNMCIALRQDLFYLMSNRHAEGLNSSEVAKTIDEVSYYADLLDDRLRNRYKS